MFKPSSRYGQPACVQSQYLNNRIEPDQGRVWRRIQLMLGFESQASAAIILSGIEMTHLVSKRQGRHAYNPSPTIAEQFDILAA